MTAGHKMDKNTKEASQQKRDKEKEKSGAASEEGRAGSTGAISSPSPSFYVPILSEGQTPAVCTPPLRDSIPSKNAVVGAADSVTVSSTPALNTSPSIPQLSNELARLSKRHDELLATMEAKDKTMNLMFTEGRKLLGEKALAEGRLDPVLRQKNRLEEEKKYLEARLESVASSVGTLQVEKDRIFSEKTTIILQLRRECNQYRSRLEELGADRDLLAIENAKVTDDLQGSEQMLSLQREFHDAQQLRQTLQDKKQENAQLKIANASLESSVRRAERIAEQRQMELELFKQSRERVAVPLQVELTNLTAELNATKEELEEWKAKATSTPGGHPRSATGTPSMNEDRAASARRETEKLTMQNIELEKKLTKANDELQRALRNALIKDNQVNVLEDKLTKYVKEKMKNNTPQSRSNNGSFYNGSQNARSHRSHRNGGHQSPNLMTDVHDLLRANVLLEAKYRALMEEKDESENTQLMALKRTFEERKQEYDQALATKDRELAVKYEQIEKLRSERNFQALELEQHRHQAQKAASELGAGSGSEKTKVLRDFMEKNKALVKEKAVIETETHELRKRVREMEEQAEADRGRVHASNQRFLTVSLEAQAHNAKNVTLGNHIHSLEEQKREMVEKMGKLSEQIKSLKVSQNDTRVQNLLLQEKVTVAVNENKALQEALAVRHASEQEARKEFLNQERVFRDTLEQERTYHAQVDKELKSQHASKLENITAEKAFMEQTMKRVEARNKTLERDNKVLLEAGALPRGGKGGAGRMLRIGVEMKDAEVTARLKISQKDEAVLMKTITELKNKISFLEDVDKARAEEVKSSQKAMEAMEEAAKRQKVSLQKIEEVNVQLRTSLDMGKAREKELTKESHALMKLEEANRTRGHRVILDLKQAIARYAELRKAHELLEQRESDLVAENSTLTKALDSTRTLNEPLEEQVRQLLLDLRQKSDQETQLRDSFRVEKDELRAQLDKCEAERVDALEACIAQLEEKLKDKDEVEMRNRRLGADVEQLRVKLGRKERTLLVLQSKLGEGVQAAVAMALSERRSSPDTVEGDTGAPPCPGTMDMGMEMVPNRAGSGSSSVPSSTGGAKDPLSCAHWWFNAKVVELENVVGEEMDTEVAHLRQEREESMRKMTAIFEQTLAEKEAEIEAQKALVRDLKVEREECMRSIKQREEVNSMTETMKEQESQLGRDFADSEIKRVEHAAGLEGQIRSLEADIRSWEAKYKQEEEKCRDLLVHVRKIEVQLELSKKNERAMEQSVLESEQVRENYDRRVREVHADLVRMRAEKMEAEVQKELKEEKIIELKVKVDQLMSETAFKKETEAVFRVNLDLVKKQKDEEMELQRKMFEEEKEKNLNRIAELREKIAEMQVHEESDRKVFREELSMEREKYMEEKKMIMEQAARDIEKLKIQHGDLLAHERTVHQEQKKTNHQQMTSEKASLQQKLTQLQDAKNELEEDMALKKASHQKREAELLSAKKKVDDDNLRLKSQIRAEKEKLITDQQHHEKERKRIEEEAAAKMKALEENQAEAKKTAKEEMDLARSVRAKAAQGLKEAKGKVAELEKKEKGLVAKLEELEKWKNNEIAARSKLTAHFALINRRMVELKELRASDSEILESKKKLELQIQNQDNEMVQHRQRTKNHLEKFSKENTLLKTENRNLQAELETKKSEVQTNSRLVFNSKCPSEMQIQGIVNNRMLRVLKVAQILLSKKRSRDEVGAGPVGDADKDAVPATTPAAAGNATATHPTPPQEGGGDGEEKKKKIIPPITFKAPSSAKNGATPMPTAPSTKTSLRNGASGSGTPRSSDRIGGCRNNSQNEGSLGSSTGGTPALKRLKFDSSS